MCGEGVGGVWYMCVCDVCCVSVVCVLCVWHLWYLCARVSVEWVQERQREAGTWHTIPESA